MLSERPLGYVPLNAAMSVKTTGRGRPTSCAISDGARQLSYSQLGDRIDRVCNGMRHEYQVPQTECALILAPDCIEYIEIVLGVSLAGMATATPSSRLSPAEISAIVDDCAPSVLFVHESCLDSVRAVSLPKIVIGADYERWLGANRPAADQPWTDECAAFSIPYTSGTTGRPKGVLLSHRSRVLTAQAMAVEYGCFGPEDAHLAIAPLCHGAGFAFALAALSFGGRLELLGAFDPEKVLRKLSTDAFTSTFMVPTHFHGIFDLESDVLERYRSFPALKTIISNAAPLPSATKERILAYWGDGRLFECYGSTENGIVSNLRPADQRRKQQCVGLPFPNTEVSILDEQHQPVRGDGVGKIYTRSPYLFNGYLNRVEQTESVFHEGWVSVGDLGRWDEDGYLYIVGREQDMVISGGINIYPKEVEDAIALHPAVLEAAVVGVADSRWGESLSAFVVLRSGMRPTAEEITEHCRSHIAAFKVPKAVHFLNALPKNSAGKILKRELLKMT